jgi:hypothetical protein
MTSYTGSYNTLDISPPVPMPYSHECKYIEEFYEYGWRVIDFILERTDTAFLEWALTHGYNDPRHWTKDPMTQLFEQDQVYIPHIRCLEKFGFKITDEHKKLLAGNISQNVSISNWQGSEHIFTNPVYLQDTRI